MKHNPEVVTVKEKHPAQVQQHGFLAKAGPCLGQWRHKWPIWVKKTAKIVFMIATSANKPSIWANGSWMFSLSATLCPGPCGGLSRRISPELALQKSRNSECEGFARITVFFNLSVEKPRNYFAWCLGLACGFASSRRTIPESVWTLNIQAALYRPFYKSLK